MRSRSIVSAGISTTLLLAAAGCDLFVPPEQIGGATYGATVVEQLDGRTLRIDLGPPKGSEPRGVVVMHAVPATRFNLTAGVHQRTYVGSLDPHLGSGIPVTVRIVNSPRPDGSYTLLELTTNTR
jgi:hypothetical protein